MYLIRTTNLTPTHYFINNKSCGSCISFSSNKSSTNLMLFETYKEAQDQLNEIVDRVKFNLKIEEY